jgi:hypothetical protein
MSSEIKGFQIDTCFESGGCPNRAIESNSLFNSLENLLTKEDILKFLRQNIGNNIKSQLSGLKCASIISICYIDKMDKITNFIAL